MRTAVPACWCVGLALLAFAPAAHAGRQSLLEGPRTIRGFGFESFTFEVPGDWMRDPRLSGRLEVTAGGRKDLDVVLLRESELAAWEKDEAVTPLHAAKRSGTVDLDVPLPGPGRYVLVLSNRFSKLARKQVRGEALLTWADDPSLPAGEALRRQVRFLDPAPLPPFEVAVDAEEPAAAVLATSAGADSVTLAVRRGPGVSPRTTAVAGYAGRIEEVGTVDVHGDGDRDVLIVGSARPGTARRRDLLLVCPRQQASLMLSWEWPEAPGPAPPRLRHAPGYAQARFSSEQSFLERLAPAYAATPPGPAR